MIGVLLTIYIIPFTIIPPPCFIKNNKSALDHAEFAANAINELVINKCATEVFSRPYCCNIFLSLVAAVTSGSGSQ